MQPWQNPALSFEDRAHDLISRMTLEEKISQMGYYSSALSRFGIPEYNWWNECLHGVARAGVATVFPQAIGMAASFNDGLMHDVADAISTEARAKHHAAARQEDRGIYKGLTYWSPNVNIFRDPRWGRGHETYGEDPVLTAHMGVQFIRGLQGDDPKYLKLVATAKHYAVHSGPEALRKRKPFVPYKAFELLFRLGRFLRDRLQPRAQIGNHPTSRCKSSSAVFLPAAPTSPAGPTHDGQPASHGHSAIASRALRSSIGSIS